MIVTSNLSAIDIHSFFDLNREQELIDDAKCSIQRNDGHLIPGRLYVFTQYLCFRFEEQSERAGSRKGSGESLIDLELISTNTSFGTKSISSQKNGKGFFSRWKKKKPEPPIDPAEKYIKINLKHDLLRISRNLRLRAAKKHI